MSRHLSSAASLVLFLAAFLALPALAQTQTSYTLRIYKSGSGSGTVTSSPAGIDCGSTCTANYGSGTSITLTAAPAAGSIFQSWSGCTSSSGATCTVNLTAAKNVYATFAPAQYSFTLYKQGSGTGVVTSNPAGIDCGSTCSASFANGASVTFTATPDSGQIFQGWSGSCTGTASTCTVTMSSSKSAYANFAPPTLALTVSKSGVGTVTSSPAGIDCGATCAANFTTNGTVTLTAVPGADQLFKSWSGCTSSSGTTCTVTLSAAKTVYATFIPAYFPVTVTLAGTGSGTVTSTPAGINCAASCSANFANGASVTLTATPTPASGYVFQGWSGRCSGMETACTLTMNEAKSVTAAFGPPTTTYLYDANGNLTQVTDPLGKVRKATYDALERPYLVQEPHATTLGSTQGQITTAYDGRSQVASVKDPRNLTTGYTVDGLGNLLTLASPDTGTTSYSYDEAGNLKTRTDSRGKLTTYSYDVLNRLTQIAYGDQTVVVTWDTCSNGIGRLCRIDDGAGSTAYGYDPEGRVTVKAQTVGQRTLVTGYEYNSAGQLTATVTPSGQVVAFEWAQGRVAAIRVNGMPLLSAVSYQPFGPVSGWTWGNGEEAGREFDLAGRLVGLSLGRTASGQADARWYRYDGAGRIVSVRTVTDTTLNQFLSYDGLDRLTSTQFGEPTLDSLGYSYDLSGNRTSQTFNGSITTYTTPGTSNRLQSLSGAQVKSFAYDTAGNQTGSGSLTYGYDNAGRKTSLNVGGQTWTYAYSALGERVRKAGPGTTTLYAYDLQGHLQGEYDGTGGLIQETVWLGDTPVATIRPGGAVYYVHADHLNTPRRITRPSDNKPVWEWESAPFGDSLANENPAGVGAFAYNLRFPGQVYDAESGTNYNYFRDYDPGTGRYVESDPIGLSGGINTYTYVNGNPISGNDPLGLWWPGIHDSLAYTQARDLGWSQGDAGYLGQLAGAVDSEPGSQDRENSHWHAMRDPRWDAEETQRNFDKYVNDNISDCSSKAGLAKALHAIQDSYSPAHRFQPWWGRDRYNSWAPVELFPHFLGDGPWHISEMAAARAATRHAIKQWMERCKCK